MKRRNNIQRQRGSVLIWVAICLVVFVGVTALAVDVGHIFNVHAELFATAESASLAGASGLSISDAKARAKALDYAAKNSANGSSVQLLTGDIELGLWDENSQTFTPVPDGTPGIQPDAVRVTPRLTEQRGSAVGLFFAGIFGLQTADVATQAVAYYGSRDIALVLDLSGSMNDDSELQHINKSGLNQAAIESNLSQIWSQLNLNGFGTMQFQPVFIPADDNNTILTTLGLDVVAYPYPSGSWFDYFNYVKKDGAINNAGCRKHYGYLTLVNYWLARQPMADQTPDLWMIDEQPITAVKNAVTIFQMLSEY